jgi:hypothetical protein
MVVRRRWWNLSAALVSVAVLTLAGCSGSDKEPTPIRTIQEGGSGVVYVGKVDASSANIGLVTQGGQLAGLVCQDAKRSLRLDAVTIDSGSAILRHDGKDVGTVSVADDIAVGTVEFDGSKRRFMAEPATGDAGVYRVAAANPDEAWEGWVVLNDGSFTGTTKAKPTSGSPWINPDSQP